MKYKSVRGMDDILPEEIGVWRYLEEKARRDLESWGFSEIRTPILEDTAVFTRSIGEGTDIVKKEMYTFKDRKDRSLTMRPEGTAPIVRAYIEHSLNNLPSGSRLYYIGPMFRSERPQKGRTRQFYQIGAEVFGEGSPYADAELIMQLTKMLGEFGLKDFTIKLNTLGCRRDKEKFAEALKKYLKDKESRLCEDCRARLEKNVLRILDCKSETCSQVVRNAPAISDNLCVPCSDYYKKAKESLEAMKIGFNETKNLVRGLDYYTGTVFEIAHPALGAQDAIGAGGRYDNLVKDMGGPSTPAIGYALGVERLILALKSRDISGNIEAKISIFIGTLGDLAKLEGLKLADELRQRIPKAVIRSNTMESSIKSQLRSADRFGSRFVLILGEDEIKENACTLKDMVTKEQVKVGRKDIIDELIRRTDV